MVSSFQIKGVIFSRSRVVRIEAISALTRSNDACRTASRALASDFFNSMYRLERQIDDGFESIQDLDFIFSVRHFCPTIQEAIPEGKIIAMLFDIGLNVRQGKVRR
jgi:hypothetical protein